MQYEMNYNNTDGLTYFIFFDRSKIFAGIY